VENIEKEASLTELISPINCVFNKLKIRTSKNGCINNHKVAKIENINIKVKVSLFSKANFKVVYFDECITNLIKMIISICYY